MNPHRFVVWISGNPEDHCAVCGLAPSNGIHDVIVNPNRPTAHVIPDEGVCPHCGHVAGLHRHYTRCCSCDYRTARTYREDQEARLAWHAFMGIEASDV